MARYDFCCHDCRTVFEENRPMLQANWPAVCPTCGSEATYKLLNQITVLAAAPAGERVAGAMNHGGGGCGCGACACAN